MRFEASKTLIIKSTWNVTPRSLVDRLLCQSLREMFCLYHQDILVNTVRKEAGISSEALTNTYPSIRRFRGPIWKCYVE
jgi:hypothetical protein